MAGTKGFTCKHKLGKGTELIFFDFAVFALKHDYYWEETISGFRREKTIVINKHPPNREGDTELKPASSKIF